MSLMPRRPATQLLSPFVEPLHPSEQEKPPQGDAWVHEIKFDGYRVQAHVAGGEATVYTRRGNDWTRQFRPLADAVAKLPAKCAIIDGEAVVLSESGLATVALLLCFAHQLIILKRGLAYLDVGAGAPRVQKDRYRDFRVWVALVEPCLQFTHSILGKYAIRIEPSL